MTKTSGGREMAFALTDKIYTETVSHWQKITPIVHMPKNDDDYDRLNSLLGRLLDEVANDESHPLISLVDTVSNMIDAYDDGQGEHDLKGTALDALKFLMDQHGLKQKDLSDVVSQGVLSEILNGKRKLNLNQIKKLSLKFKVSPDTFID